MRNITPSRAVYPSPTPFSGHLIPDTSFPPPLVYIDTALGSVVALYVVGPQLAGHPNILHGGASAALVDEIMGCTAVERLPARKVAVTATLELTYKAPVFLGSDGGWGLVAVCARVQSAAGRMAQVVGSVENIKTGQKLTYLHSERRIIASDALSQTFLPYV
ncbi:HotDog domain-containing protein [Colletotrichum phormii]|uniref:HotDog domain-containing protein n=1 Tax=Colletotrichum phormii TaxID=359342 RepID=A0AAJ0E8W8_9PEZI|nr:HotDog domain-containing protein [Colletotrichum phormii]KAK1623309.1 HotDog domain-containing protein [Colletotrichum phormii]